MPAWPFDIPVSIVFWKNTYDSWEWASDKAHRRKYEAVFEMQPKTYSIVSINWCTNIYPASTSYSAISFTPIFTSRGFFIT